MKASRRPPVATHGAVFTPVPVPTNPPPSCPCHAVKPTKIQHMKPDENASVAAAMP